MTGFLQFLCSFNFRQLAFDLEVMQWMTKSLILMSITLATVICLRVVFSLSGRVFVCLFSGTSYCCIYWQCCIRFTSAHWHLQSEKA